MKKNFVKRVKKSTLSCLLVIAVMAQIVFVPQTTLADDNVYLEINGYQISTTLEAFRTIYSIAAPEGKTEEVGLVYGITEFVTEDDMKVGSSNNTVFTYAATELGRSSVSYSKYDNASTYFRTMKLIKTKEFYERSLSVRAYAKLKDGSYIYSDISTVSVYRIADMLYKNSLMNSVAGHEYLYENILSKVDSSYKAIEYSGKTIVTPDKVPHEESTAEETTKYTEPETTTAKSVVPGNDGWTPVVKP